MKYNNFVFTSSYFKTTLYNHYHHNNNVSNIYVKIIVVVVISLQSRLETLFFTFHLDDEPYILYIHTIYSIHSI